MHCQGIADLAAGYRQAPPGHFPAPVPHRKKTEKEAIPGSGPERIYYTNSSFIEGVTKKRD
jgi:hypothetical protein